MRVVFGNTAVKRMSKEMLPCSKFALNIALNLLETEQFNQLYFLIQMISHNMLVLFQNTHPEKKNFAKMMVTSIKPSKYGGGWEGRSAK